MVKIIFSKATLEYSIDGVPVTIVVHKEAREFKVTVYEDKETMSTLDVDLYRVLYPILQQLRGY